MKRDPSTILSGVGRHIAYRCGGVFMVCQGKAWLLPAAGGPRLLKPGTWSRIYDTMVSEAARAKGLTLPPLDAKADIAILSAAGVLCPGPEDALQRLCPDCSEARALKPLGPLAALVAAK